MDDIIMYNKGYIEGYKDAIQDIRTEAQNKLNKLKDKNNKNEMWRNKT